jgi:hypothetical protein
LAGLSQPIRTMLAPVRNGFARVMPRHMLMPE